MIGNAQHVTRSIFIGVALGYGVLAAAMLGSATALACGLTIHDDFTLQGDLTGCEGDGLVVAADGVTIDLNGHSIVGLRKERTAGIRAYGISRLTIRNGAIAGFERGVYLYDVSDVSVAGVEVNFNRYEGLMAYRSDGVNVTDSTFRNNARSAIWIYDTDAELIGNWAFDNPARAFYISGGRVVLSGNSVRGGAYYSAFTLANGYSPSTYAFADNLAEDVLGVGYLFAVGFTGEVIDLGGNRALNTGSVDCWSADTVCPLDLSASSVGSICGDGICEDQETVYSCSSDCGLPPNEVCDDGGDNDGDGAVDCDDADDCGLDPSCEPAPVCVPPGASCTADEDCCSQDCRTRGTRVFTCR